MEKVAHESHDVAGPGHGSYVASGVVKAPQVILMHSQSWKTNNF